MKNEERNDSMKMSDGCPSLAFFATACPEPVEDLGTHRALKCLRDQSPEPPATSAMAGVEKDDLYCLSYTAVLLYFLPLASVPLTATVRLLPSAATTTWAVRVTLPPFFDST